MGPKPMTYEQAARILDPETSLEALAAYAGDCEARQAAIVEACRMGAIALRAMQSSEPLTAEQLRRMHFERLIVSSDRGPEEWRKDAESVGMAISALRPVSREPLEKFKEFFDDLYGKGLEVYGWHMNGEAKSFDDFHEDACEYAGL